MRDLPSVFSRAGKPSPARSTSPYLTRSTAVTPYPPVKGSVANLNVRGELGGATVDGGTITTTTYYKVRIAPSLEI